MRLDREMASRFTAIALGHVRQEYPHKLDHVLTGDEDAVPPHMLHPIFFGSFDWHSCVHGWWMLLTVRRLYPDMGQAAEIAALADAGFTADKVAAELAYLDRSQSAGFERPYGWAWLLMLHLEASRHDDRDWAARLEPLARAFAGRFTRYLDMLTYPIRTGTHFNSAFALVLAGEWAARFDAELATTIAEKTSSWFGDDRDCQAWEPGGDEFLSPALMVALAMARVLPRDAFADWFAAFLPRIAEHRPASLFTPATVSDRSDGKIAHLDGLNLSRAWCWRSIAPLLPVDQQPLVARTAVAHLAAALGHVAGDYAGEHWLASFALLALMAE